MTDTLEGIDIELMYSLGEELEKKCEAGDSHDMRIWGHDDGALWYALVMGTCNCLGENPMRIYCNGFIADSERIQKERGIEFSFICLRCGENWNIKRLEPVK